MVFGGLLKIQIIFCYATTSRIIASQLLKLKVKSNARSGISVPFASPAIIMEILGKVSKEKWIS